MIESESETYGQSLIGLAQLSLSLLTPAEQTIARQTVNRMLAAADGVGPRVLVTATFILAAASAGEVEGIPMAPPGTP